MNGLLLSDDLIFSSKVTATARAHGLSVRVAKTVAQLRSLVAEQVPTGVILDLHNETLAIAELLAELRGVGVRSVVAYGSHVDAARLKAAREAGCDRVMPRSQFVDRLESDLANWLTAE